MNRPTLVELAQWKNDPKLIAGLNATYVVTAAGFQKVPARVYYGFYEPEMDKAWERMKKEALARGSTLSRIGPPEGF